MVEKEHLGAGVISGLVLEPALLLDVLVPSSEQFHFMNRSMNSSCLLAPSLCRVSINLHLKEHQFLQKSPESPVLCLPVNRCRAHPRAGPRQGAMM